MSINQLVKDISEEKESLVLKMDKLKLAINHPESYEISESHLILLKRQWDVMYEYYRILDERISNLTLTSK